MQKFDVLIVGAGMVGLTLALALRKTSQLSVALVDNNPIDDIDEELDVRVSAINIASKNIFENLDVWSAIKESRAQAYQNMHVWDKSGIGKLDFSADDNNSILSEEETQGPVGSSVVSVNVTLPAVKSAELGVYTALGADVFGEKSPVPLVVHNAELAAPPIVPSSVYVLLEHITALLPAETVTVSSNVIMTSSFKARQGPTPSGSVTVAVTVAVPIIFSALVGV